MQRYDGGGSAAGAVAGHDGSTDMKAMVRMLAVIAMAIVVMCAAFAPVAASAQFGSDPIDDAEMRGWVKNDASQVLVAMEVDAFTSRDALSIFWEFNPDMIEDSMDVMVVDELIATPADVREAGVTRMTIYAVVDIASVQPGLVVVAQDGRYVYMFYLLAIEDDADLDVETLYDVLLDTGEWLLESIKTPRGWTEVDLGDDDGNLIGI